MISLEGVFELEAAAGKYERWNSWANLLDSVNTLDELEVIEDYVRKYHPEKNNHLLDYYREILNKWPDPQLSYDFKYIFSLTAQRLDTPQKIRIFLRGAEFCGADPEFLAWVVEPIIFSHEVNGNKVINVKLNPFPRDLWVHRPKNKRCFILSILSRCTQLQAWTLLYLLFPGIQLRLLDGHDNVIFDWRTKEEREAANDH